MKSLPFEACSVLSPRPVASSKNGFTDADRALFRMLGAMTNGSQSSLLIIDAPYDNQDLLQGLWLLAPGGFLFMNGDFGVALKFFKPRGWERVPFMWRDYFIYRKPHRGVGAGA